MSAAARTGGGADALPRLRTDLGVEHVADPRTGLPAIIIRDPLKGTYFRLEWPMSAIYCGVEKTADRSALSAYLVRTFGLIPTDDDVSELIQFATANELTLTAKDGSWKAYDQKARAGKGSLIKSLAHNYLFFRIPLLHPDALLRRLISPLSFVYARTFWLCIAAVAAAGLYLASRQWSAVLDAGSRALQFESLTVFAVSALFLKALHELGHALTTVRFGCRVPSMGVAFMLGAPVLYTDTSDAWRLTDDRKRLAIVMAGVAAEMIVAAFAILAWALLAEGSARQIAFSLATTSVVMTLAVNLNPFMRFDGYFALSDAWRLPNLQGRAFALATWAMREFLFNLGETPPEAMDPRRRRLVIAYAYATWVYRFFLYLGIAALVYYMAGKALGIVLGLFELIVFILKPLIEELRAWWMLRDRIRHSINRPVAVVLVPALLAVVFVPWIGTVEVPAVLISAEEHDVHLPSPALITRIHVTNGQTVAKGDLLFEARSPDLEHELKKARLKTRLAQLKLSRLHGNEEAHAERLVLESERKHAEAAVRALEARIAELVIRAPAAGRAVDRDGDVREGAYISEESVLIRITDPGAAALKGMIAETDGSRLTGATTGVFLADDPTEPRRRVQLTVTVPAGDGRLSEAALADLYGGAVAAESVQDHLRTRDGWISANFSADGVAPSSLTRGIIRLEAEPISPARLAWRQVARVLVREQGF